MLDAPRRQRPAAALLLCPACGSRLWHEREGVAESLSVKAGSLDEPVDFSTAIHIWTARKLPGFDIPEAAVQFPEEPD